MKNKNIWRLCYKKKLKCHKNREKLGQSKVLNEHLTQYTNANETSTWKKTAMVGEWPSVDTENYSLWPLPNFGS